MHELKSITLHVEGDVPPMIPAGATAEYRAARLALSEAEAALLDQVEAVAAQRRALPEGILLPDYALTEGPRDLDVDGPATPVSLLDLFGDHGELVVYHLMFHPDDDAACPMCSLWVDGLHGVSHHLARRAGFAVVGAAPLDKLRTWGRRRGWHGLRLVSAEGTAFATDLGTQGAAGGQSPAVSVFTRSGVQVRHTYTRSAQFPDQRGRGMDLLAPVWQVWDLLPSGRGDWLPDNTYPTSARG